MGIQVPVATNYPSPLVAIPCLLNKDAVEGESIVPVEIDWATMGGTNNCCYISLGGLAAQTISQIVAISIDNSQCGSDVQFIFPDTSQSYLIPAYAPATTFEVFTSQTQFYVLALNEKSQDVTRFGVLNFLPPPIAVPSSREQEVSIQASATLVAGTTQVIPAGVNGTLENLNLACIVSVASGSFNALVTLQDGSGQNVFQGNVGGNNSSTINYLMASLNDISIRFQNGLKMLVNVTGTANPGGTLSVNAYYRTP
jgi:hypothetical protein